MLSFSGDELKSAITTKEDWGGLTDILRATIALYKGVVKSSNHELWMEHDVNEMASNLVNNEKLEVNFGELNDDLMYDDAQDSVKMSILELVQCRVQQKKSWWEDGIHQAYVHFCWPEGDNLGHYHVIFNTSTEK